MHEVESLMYGKQKPWHGIGVYVGEENILSKEALAAAGLDWKVEKHRVFSMIGDDVVEDPSSRMVVRDTDKMVMGTVGRNYELFQNDEAFEAMDNLVADGAMKYNVAMSLKNGRKVALLGKIDGTIEPFAGDQVDNYVLLSNSHDGSGALRILFTPVRVVCANTLRLALEEGRGDGVTIRHTRNMRDNVAQAKYALKLANKQFDKFGEIAKSFANTSLKSADFNRFAEFVAGFEPLKEPTTHQRYVAGEIVRLSEEGIGCDIPGVRGTAWAAFNAVTEYYNYYKDVKPRGGEVFNESASRLHNLWFGTSSKSIDEAMSYLNTKQYAMIA